MKNRILKATLLALSFTAVLQAEITPDTCASLSDESVARKRRDVVLFDHAAGQVVWPNPARLLLHDGDVFVVVFKDTDATKFDYLLSGISSDDLPKTDWKAEPTGLVSVRNDTVCVSWRFDSAFSLYRLAVRGRESALEQAALARSKSLAQIELMTDSAPKIEAHNFVTKVTPNEILSGVAEEQVGDFIEKEPNPDNQNLLKEVQKWLESASNPQEKVRSPYTFPIWVEDVGFKVGFASGFGFSDLASDRYFVKKNDHGTDDPEDDTETIERSSDGKDSFLPDLMAFATATIPIRHRSLPDGTKGPLFGSSRLGIAVGVGIGGESEPRYFFGPCLTLGPKFLLAVGAFGGKVDRLPAGQELGQAPISGSNTLAQLDSKFDTGFGLSLAWRFGDGEKYFMKALQPAQKSGE